MKALVTLLPEPFYQKILSLWGDLEAEFGFNNIYATPQPHFTWQYGDNYRDGYLDFLNELCLLPREIEVRTDIVTWFAAVKPIIYLRVVKTPELADLHRILWERLFPLCENPSLLYAPDSWEPHITLAMEERDWLRLPEVYRFLKSRDLSWTFPLDNLTVLCQNDEKAARVEKEFVFCFDEGQ